MIILALFFIVYCALIPGTGSITARDISVILGLMVSRGSTSTVGNLIVGIVLAYTRPSQLGDRVKIGDATGAVMEKTFLYAKVLTIKNKEGAMMRPDEFRELRNRRRSLIPVVLDRLS